MLLKFYEYSIIFSCPVESGAMNHLLANQDNVIWQLPNLVGDCTFAETGKRRGLWSSARAWSLRCIFVMCYWICALRTLRMAIDLGVHREHLQHIRYLSVLFPLYLCCGSSKGPASLLCCSCSSGAIPLASTISVTNDVTRSRFGHCCRER